MAEVLVIDDHPWDRALLVTVLGHAGHHVVEARDGREGLALLEHGPFDLVICDVLMPTMDGYEFVRTLRADPRHSAQKVVFYTATFHERESQSLAETLGVIAILTKPCEPARILRIVTDALASPAVARAEADAEFARKHTRLLNDKLLEKVDELDRANGHLKALTELSLSLSSENDPRRLLEHFCRGARDLFEARRAMLLVRDRYDSDDLYRVTRGFTKAEEDALMPGGIEVGILGDVMRDRSTLHIVSADHLDNAALSRMPRWREALLAPIASLNEVYGWVLLMDRVIPADYSTVDAQQLTAHAAHAGRIYENGRLNNRLERQIVWLEDEIASRRAAEAQVDRLNRVYALLSRLNALIVRVKTRDDLYREICNIAVEQGRFVKAWILEHKPEGPTLAGIAGCTPEYEARLRARAFGESLSQAGFYREIVEQQKGLTLDDLLDREEVARQFQKIDPYGDLVTTEALLTGSRSLLWLPIVVNGKTAAILALHAAEPAFFNLVERKPLDELAGDIGYALEHIARTEQLDYLAFYDVLTGLANHRLIAERLTQQIQSPAQDSRQIAVAVFDISRFAQINDAFGRQIGDRLLKQVALRLVEGIDRDHVGRLGGNTFVIARYDVRDEAALAHFVEERLLACFRSPFFVDGHEILCSAHVGVAIFPLDGDTADAVLHNAETAMTRAKKNRSTYLFYNQLMSERVAEQVLLESELRGALGRDEFVLYYQPKLDMQTLQVDGVEALLRWKNPRLGLVAPSRFIPLLEETGMIVEVGVWALHESARAHARWRARGDAPRVAVNVSAIQLRSSNFESAIFGDRGTPLDGIDIEITESLLMEDIETNLQKLNMLRDRGMNIAIDDFGTGYSSFAYLTRLPAQTLKIDGSFIAKIDAGAQHESIVDTMIVLAHRLGMTVVAEGVETESQARMLRELHCDTAQGYLYCRPIPFDEITTFLESRRVIA